MAHPDMEDLMAFSKQYMFNAMVVCTTSPRLGISFPEGPLSASLGPLNHGDSV